MRIEAISNGQGGQSLLLCHFASEGKIPATISITADTGAERDCLWNTGERTSAREYFDQVTNPLCNQWGIDAYFVRAEDKDKHELIPLDDWHGENAPSGTHMPLYGSNGGQLSQTCTDKWKLRAIRQQARRLGASHLCTAQGIHAGEAWRRVKGVYVGVSAAGYDLYHPSERKDEDGKPVPIKWQTHYYPLVKFRLNRQAVRERLEHLGIPYLISSECDICPHKDAARWLRSSPETIERATNLESRYNGEFFLTDRRRPLPIVMNEYREELRANPGLFERDEATFGCDGGVCGI